MSTIDEQEKRIAQILSDGNTEGEDMGRSPETVNKYLQYLKKEIEFPCCVTGMEDFPWEEEYVFGGGNKKKYERLKKDNPSYKDTFELIELEEPADEQILVKVKRLSDKKEFVIELDLLKATDEKSKNYQLLDDYSFWYVNY